jgi:hypothetical protein
LAASGRCHSPWEHAPLVGNRANLGQILLRPQVQVSFVPRPLLALNVSADAADFRQLSGAFRKSNAQFKIYRP